MAEAGLTLGVGIATAPDAHRPDASDPIPDGTPADRCRTGVPNAARARRARRIRDVAMVRALALTAGCFVRSLKRSPPGIYTLCYHHVSERATPNFSAQLALLKGHGTFIGADAAIERLVAGSACDGVFFVLTFDDGYRDTVETAMPIILHHEIPAMLFLVSEWLDRPPPDGQSYASRADVGRWLRAGLDVGSHSASHRRLTTLSGQEVGSEMERSAVAVRDLRGAPARHFACPWGVAEADFQPERDVTLARAAGYESFFTTRRGRARDAGALSAMPRHVLEPEWPLSHIEALIGGWRFGPR